jgi:hypothetical protein
MEQYISKAALVAEIERRKHKLLDNIMFERDKEWVVRTAHQLNRIIWFLDTLEIPCWSLAALLDALPSNLQLALAINDYQGGIKEKYAIGSVEHDKYDCFADNSVDACYEMIITLHEQKLL